LAEDQKVMTGESFLRELEKVLEREPGTLTPATKLEEIGWDSLGELSFLALADRTLGRQVEATRLSSCVTAGDLLVLLGPSIAG
jgi:acyl carrier protein